MDEDTLHCFFTCDYSKEVSLSLLRAVREDIPTISEEKLLTLDYGDVVEVTLELAVTWLLAAIWVIMWEYRKNKKKCKLYSVRADLEARCNLLRETRFKQAAEKIFFIISKMSL